MTQSNEMPDELEIGVFYAPAPMSEHFMSVIDSDTKTIPEKKARYKKIECRSVFMPEGDVIEIPITAPCGDEITIKEKAGNRTYWYKGKVIWNPQEVHRVGLLTVMLKEDEIRYKEKQAADLNPPQSPNRAVLDALRTLAEGVIIRDQKMEEYGVYTGRNESELKLAQEVYDGKFMPEHEPVNQAMLKCLKEVDLFGNTDFQYLSSNLCTEIRRLIAAANQADEVKVIDRLEEIIKDQEQFTLSQVATTKDYNDLRKVFDAAKEHLKRQKGQ